MGIIERELMAALEPLYQLLAMPEKKMSKNEMLLTEVILFLQLESALNKTIQHTHRVHERFIEDHCDKEIMMQDTNFVKNMIEDILSTEEYSLEGIAYHLKIPEEILSDILVGYNQSPSLTLARQIMEVHKCVRRDLYHHLLKKIALLASQTIACEEL